MSNGPGEQPLKGTEEREPMRLMNRLRPGSFGLPASLVLLAAQPLATFSQNSGNEVAVAGLEEIVVTATKRRESLQDIPISTTAFSDEAIKNLNFIQARDIADQVPNMQFLDSGAPGIPFIFLRGLGNTSFFSNSIRPVALYMDEAYIGQSTAQQFALYDLERIEVLRGPQGTIFGRNATAGLVSYISKRPDIDAGVTGRVELTAGEYDFLRPEAALGLPLGDKAAARVAAFYESASGWYRNVEAGDDYGEVDTFGARAQVLWAPTDGLDILLSGRYGEDDSDLGATKPGYQNALFNCPPGGAVSGQFNNGCADPFGFGHEVDPDLHNVQYAITPFQDVESSGVSLRIDWELGDYTLTSLTAWDQVDMHWFADDDGSPLSVLDDVYMADSDWLNQEIRVLSQYDGPLNFIAGVNYYSDDLDSELLFASDDIETLIVGSFGLTDGTHQILNQQTDTWAVYAEGTWDITDTWRLRVGARVTYDERKVDVRSNGFDAVFGPNFTGTPVTRVYIPEMRLKDDWTEPTGRIALDWRFADEQMLYASYSRGFKGGEFSTRCLWPPTCRRTDVSIRSCRKGLA